MDDRNENEGLTEKVGDFVRDVFGGDKEEAAIEDPQLVGDEMVMPVNEQRDIGMGVRGVDSDPYGGSAASKAMELAEEGPPGTPGQNPPDSALTD